MVDHLRVPLLILNPRMVMLLLQLAIADASTVKQW